MASCVKSDQIRCATGVNSGNKKPSLTDGSVIKIFQENDVEGLRKLILEYPSILTEKDSKGVGIASYVANSDSIELCEVVFGKNPELFSPKNEQGRTAFRDALYINAFKAVCWMKDKDLNHFFEKDENGDNVTTWAAKNGFEDVMSFLVNEDPTCVFDMNDKTKETPFLIACRMGHMGLIEMLFNVDVRVLHSRNSYNETSFQLACQSDESVELVGWFCSCVNYGIYSEVEAECFIEIMKRLDKELVKAILGRSSLYCFIPKIGKIKRFLGEESDTVKKLKSLVEGFPKRFVFQQTEAPFVTDEEIIRYYDLIIPDIESITDPCRDLKRLFEVLTEQDHLENMNLGRKEAFATQEEARLERKKILTSCDFLLDVIEQEKPDQSIPVGQERFYYAHLKKIEKHLVHSFQNPKDLSQNQKNNLFTYLRMIDGASGSCYPNYSTMFHSLYANLTNDSSVAERVAQEELPSGQFFHEMKAFYERKIKARASSFFQDTDTHVVSVLQKFFKEAFIPYYGQDVSYYEEHSFPALLVIRKDILNIKLDENDNYWDPSELYEDTKGLFLYKFNRAISSENFFYKGAQEFLLQRLKADNSEQFLAKLNDWLTENGIPTDSVLIWDEDRKEYILNPAGLCDMLKKFPKEITF